MLTDKSEQTLHERVVAFVMSAGLYNIFFIKSCLNLMIGSLLGFIIATGIILDITPMRKAYIVVSLFIILALAVDKNIRSNSKTLDMIGTIFEPINLGRGMKKVITYTRLNNCILTFSLGMIEIFKILAGVFCIVTLSVEEIPGTWVIYWVLGAMLLESFLGLILYVYFTFCVIFYKNFYMNLLRNLANWYLSESVKCEVSKQGKCLFLEFSQLDDYGETEEV